MAVLGRHIRPPVDQQPGGVAGLDGHLGDALGRQVVVQLVSVHGDRRRYRRSAMGLELRVDAVDGGARATTITTHRGTIAHAVLHAGGHPGHHPGRRTVVDLDGARRAGGAGATPTT